MLFPPGGREGDYCKNVVDITFNVSFTITNAISKNLPSSGPK
jgi:hypothetical protein